MLIRLGTEKDIESICSVEYCCFDTPWSRILFEADLSGNPNAVYFAAFDDDEPERLLGFVGTHNVAGEINITNVAVLPEARRRGIGSALIGRLTEHFGEADIIGITLEVRAGNAPAIALYEKHGFKTEGRRKNYYRDGEDALIMWRRK